MHTQYEENKSFVIGKLKFVSQFETQDALYICCVCTVMHQIKVLKVNLKAKKNAYFLHFQYYKLE